MPLTPNIEPPLLLGGLTATFVPVANSATSIANSGFIASGTVLDLASAGTLFLGNGNATAVSIGSTNIVTYLGGTGPTTGSGSTRIYNPLYSIASPATSGTTLVSSPFHYFQSNYWTTSSQTLYGGIRMVPSSTAPHGYLQFNIGTAGLTEVGRIDDLGTFYALNGGGLDTMSGGTLNVGAANATGVIVGKSSITTALGSNQINIGTGGGVSFLIIGAAMPTVDTNGTPLTIQATTGGTGSTIHGGTGGGLLLKAGPGGSGVSALNPGDGGLLTLQSGLAGTGGSGNSSSGGITLNIPAGAGSGSFGQFNFQFGGVNKVILVSTGVFAPSTANTGGLGNNSNMWASMYATSSVTNSVDTITATTLSLGTSSATGIALGKSSITTTITGSLTQLTGAFSLTGNAQSQLTTTSGSLVLDSAAGGLVDIGVTTTGGVAIGRSGITTTLNGQVALGRTTLAQSTASMTLNFATASQIDVTLSASVTTITISGLAANVPCTVVLNLIQDATGTRTLAGWPATVKWLGSTYRGTTKTAPTFSTAASKRDTLFFYWDGTNLIETDESIGN